MIYTNEELDYFKQALDKHPQQIGPGQADLEEFTGKRSSLGTLKRALKKLRILLETMPSITKS